MARDSFSRYQSYTAHRSARNKALKIFALILVFLYLVLAINRIFFTTYEVQGDSLEPNLPPGTRVILSPLAYGANIPLTPFRLPRFGVPGRGDLVYFQTPFAQNNDGFSSVVNEILRFFTFDIVSLESFFPMEGLPNFALKRVVALPGDTVKFNEHLVSIKPVGEDHFFSEFELSPVKYDVLVIDDPEMWTQSDPFSGYQREQVLGEDQVLILSDHRPRGLDSYDFGPITLDQIRAQGLLQVWPPEQFASP